MFVVGLLAILCLVTNLTAADAVLSSPRQRAWVVLDKSLKAGSGDKRQALAAIASIAGPDEHAVKRAENALQDKDPQVRQYAALALGQLHSADAIPYLKEALGDTNEVAFAAAKSLIDLGDKAGEDMLIAVISGERKNTPGILTNAVREAKRRVRHPEGLLLMGAEDATGAMFAPAAMGIEAARQTSALYGKGTPGRASAAAYLARDPDGYAIPLLEWALADDNQYVRMEAARALGQRGGAASIPKLEFALDDPHNGVRDLAAASIIRIDDRNGAEGSPSLACSDPPALPKK